MSDSYLHVTIQVVRGKSKVFYEAMAEMAAVMEENGCHLVVALTPVVGRLGAVYHVWKVPSADGFVDALTAVRAHPNAQRWADAFAESIEDEVVEFSRPTPYSRTP